MDKNVKVITFVLLCAFSVSSLVRGAQMPEVLAIATCAALFSFLTNKSFNEQIKKLQEEQLSLSKEMELISNKVSNLHNKSQLSSKSMLNR